MIIGITGGMSTGVSSAARYIARFLHADLISADKLAHELLKDTGSLTKRLVSCFGRGIIGSKGLIDRKKLAARAFSCKTDYRKLCGIAYPVIKARIDEKINSLCEKGRRSIVIDAPMLIESGFYKRCDYIVVVMASLALQIQRCKIKKLSADEALSRIRFQMPLHDKVKRADYIIHNGSSLMDLRRCCRAAGKKIKKQGEGK
ncbi:MAG: dephospho-CoA kinase [Candidatus Omnitrophica bacterium]|nr:dephospho-CoA kinase [Candidatus Omnitrophota bacterium]